MAEGQEYYDWTITCAFYFAVHCIEAHAHKHKQEKLLEPTDLDRQRGRSEHIVRQNYVSDYLPDCFTTYIRLYDASRKSRYDPNYFENISKNQGYHKRMYDCSQKLREIL